jgi:hypothetical protein
MFSEERVDFILSFEEYAMQETSMKQLANRTLFTYFI